MEIKDRIQNFVKYKGLSIKRFEEMCQLSNGYVSSMRKGLGKEKLDNVLRAFPDLNRDWLVYGEGEMLKSPDKINQHADGDYNMQISGNGNNINASALIEELSAQRKLTEKAQEQIDRLLTIIEKMQP